MSIDCSICVADLSFFSVQPARHPGGRRDRYRKPNLTKQCRNAYRNTHLYASACLHTSSLIFTLYAWQPFDKLTKRFGCRWSILPNPHQLQDCYIPDLWPPCRAEQTISRLASKTFAHCSILLTLQYREDYYSKVWECKQRTWQQFFLVKLELIGLHLHAACSTNRLASRLSACQPTRLVAAVAHSGTAQQ